MYWFLVKLKPKGKKTTTVTVEKEYSINFIVQQDILFKFAV